MSKKLAGRTKTAKCRIRRFTLLELMIVVAIIAILSAMLLPSLNKARDKAKKIYCTSNQKQLGTGFSYYLSDYKSYPAIWMFGATSTNSSKAYSYYQDFLPQYLPRKIGGVYCCPANNEINSYTNVTNYGYNYFIGYKSYGTNPSAQKTPSKTLLLIDRSFIDETVCKGMPWYAENSITGLSLFTWELAAKRHNSIFNILYLDGHNGDMKKLDLFSSNQYESLWNRCD